MLKLESVNFLEMSTKRTKGYFSECVSPNLKQLRIERVDINSDSLKTYLKKSCNVKRIALIECKFDS